MRTDMPSFGKRTPFTEKYFEKAYTAKDRTKVQDPRFTCISRALIETKSNSLDLGLMQDESSNGNQTLGEPINIAKEALSELNDINKELNAIIEELG